MKRHVGKITNTDQRCIVVYMQIPGRETHALIASTDNMKPRFEQVIMDILTSPEGQNDPVLANVLSRRVMPETNKSVLQTLHEMGMLKPMPIDNIVMLPKPNMPFPLRQIIESMGNTIPKIDNSVETTENVQDNETKYNPYVNNNTELSAEGREAIAKNLLVEARMLESEAKKKYEMAYSYAPHLNKKSASEEKVVTEELDEPDEIDPKDAMNELDELYSEIMNEEEEEDIPIVKTTKQTSKKMTKQKAS